MDVMTARRKLFAKLRTDNPAAAVGWINRDSDVHYLNSKESNPNSKAVNLQLLSK